VNRIRSSLIRPVLWSTSYLLRCPFGISIRTSNSIDSSMCGCRRTASVAGTRARVSSNSVPHADGRAARRAEGRDQRNIRAADTDIVRAGSGYLDSVVNDELIDWQVAGATARGLARPGPAISRAGAEQA